MPKPPTATDSNQHTDTDQLTSSDATNLDTDLTISEALNDKRKQAKQLAATTDPRSFVHNWLLSTSPFAFTAYSCSYFEFRQEIASILGVHSADLTLVGSAQIGFSLNPSKLFSHFNRGSDLDVAIISPGVFDDAWRDLIRTRETALMADPEEKKKFKKMRENFFEGYLRPDGIPADSRLAKDWFPKLAGPFNSNVARRHEVKAWLFKSWWHFEAFYVNGIQKSQPNLARILESAQ